MLTEFEIIFNDIKKKKPDYAASNRAQAGSELFWIDTLLIPNAEEYRVPRTETIQKMHKIYYHAKNTIVLDNSLMEESIGTCYAEPAIKITMSAWMRRLWTLQEAVFSKSIWFIFKEGAFHMDDLEKLYREENKSLHSGLTEVSRAYHNGILGDMRQGLLEQGDKYKVNTAFVAATWKAAQWRTTAQDQHETLALAILFQLDVDEFVGYIPTDPVTGLVPQDELDNRMRSFLQQLCDNRKLLPGGMIFLPGASLTGEGYGWAPRTWLSAHDVDSPDPLELSVEKPAKFQVRVGLTAKYPGFMLHSVDQKKSLLSQYKFIKFPVHHSLTEWYQLEVAESEYFPKEIDDQTKELAIINPRLPLVNVKEIALLVAIQRKPNEDFDVHVLCRVWTSRVHDPDTIDELIRKYKDRDTSIKFLGEQLRERKWTVDRAPPSPPAPSPPPPFPPHIVGSSATSEEKFEAPKLKRRTQTLIDFTNGFGNIPGRLLRLIRHSKTDETV
ncbi:hypothetical protein MMC21_006945 [Puttea exsequens]|nr:hypothetical protein [Puttea exsequens]